MDVGVSKILLVLLIPPCWIMLIRCFLKHGFYTLKLLNRDSDLLDITTRRNDATQTCQNCVCVFIMHTCSNKIYNSTQYSIYMERHKSAWCYISILFLFAFHLYFFFLLYLGVHFPFLLPPLLILKKNFTNYSLLWFRLPPTTTTFVTFKDWCPTCL